MNNRESHKRKTIHMLDKEAKRSGVPRQSIVKVWVAERLQKAS